MLYKLLTIGFILIRAVASGTPTVLAAEFKLDSRFQDTDGDMVADTPTDRSKQIDPGTLIFAYTPVKIQLCTPRSGRAFLNTWKR